ncbi:hypothetical protein ASE86_13535 [Sphingomonas sp. Leaf33]|uniref:tetratricopeptide repeat protein n=1 Tax=Sphingomonas sp. Leaf33 TaxID=1736215 RepID=UPI0006FC5FEA|nr:hypothetical protein [Sphingomonas sp. Leaf33]KQN19483.1 hypothetical protein ASE86_13535 [Sphingomonas sp. Leaf33]
MTTRRSRQGLVMLVPIALGIGMLVVASTLLPNSSELQSVHEHAQPDTPPAPATPATPPALPTPPQPSVTPTPVLPTVAQSVATQQPTWRQRFETARAAGDPAAATAMLVAAADRRVAVPAADIVAAGYALNHPDLILRAASRGAIPKPDATLALDLARRLEKTDLLPELTRVAGDGWKATDPWLALRVAERTGDTAAALRAAALLPPKDRDAAQEAILTRSGDRAGLVALLRRRAAAPGADLPAIAERLLAAGDRAAAIAVLQAASATGSPTTPAARRLLYLLGPRPQSRDVVWLLRRADSGTERHRIGWLNAYAARATPSAAIGELARHPLGNRTDIALTRLRLARAVGDDAAVRAATARLLDGRPLPQAQLKEVAAAATPPNGELPDPVLRPLAKAGLLTPEERLGQAWTRWNRGDAAGTAAILDVYLEERPGDAAALRLRGDAQAKLSGERSARPWFERALRATPAPSKTAVELLDRVGRRADATQMIADLRRRNPGDRTLAALHARLLIAQGEPGRAREILSQ